LRERCIEIAHLPESGLYLWGNLGANVDAFPIAQRMMSKGHMTAPGVLFSKAHPTYMRFNIAATLDQKMLDCLSEEIVASVWTRAT